MMRTVASAALGPQLKGKGPQSVSLPYNEVAVTKPGTECRLGHSLLIN